MEERNEQIRGIVLEAKQKYASSMAKHVMAKALNAPNLEEIEQQHEDCRDDSIALAVDLIFAGVEVARMDRVAHIISQELSHEETQSKIEFLDDTTATAVKGLVWLNTGSKDDVGTGESDLTSTRLVSAGISAMMFALNCIPGPEGQDTTARFASQIGTLSGMFASAICGSLSDDTDDKEEIEVRLKKAKNHIIDGIMAAVEMVRSRKAGEHN